MYEHVYSSLDREVGGVLIGELVGDNTLAIAGVIPALEAVGGAAEVTFTHESWEPIHRELDDRYPGKQIIGWYHSHPNFGIFMSDQDMFIHENFFSEWWQIAIVLDPIRGEEGFFFWKAGKVAQVLKRPISVERVPAYLLPRATEPSLGTSDEGSQDRSYPLGAWILPLLIGGILGFTSAPSIGVGSPEDVEPATPASAPPAVSEEPASSEEATPSVEGEAPAEIPDADQRAPTKAECVEFTQETGELLDGCPLSTLPG